MMISIERKLIIVIKVKKVQYNFISYVNLLGSIWSHTKLKNYTKFKSMFRKVTLRWITKHRIFQGRTTVESSVEVTFVV